MMKTNHQSSIINQKPVPRGFTLVELLVVIAIIAALASLLVVAINAARRAAREAAIQVDCTQLAEGFDAYTNDISGGSYPPNVTGLSTVNAEAAIRRHLNKAFPSHREPPVVISALATLTPAEAVVFWLAGFSKDPKYPISGPKGPSFNPAQGEDFSAREGYDFDVLRLGPRGGNGQFGGGGRSITYQDPRTPNQQRQINFWQYYPKNLTQPYAYYDASRRPLVEPVFGSIAPIKMLKLNATNATVSSIQLANEGKCQILSAGLDDAWGTPTTVDWPNPSTAVTVPLYPDGPWTGDMADNIVNFSVNRTLEKSQP